MLRLAEYWQQTMAIGIGNGPFFQASNAMMVKALASANAWVAMGIGLLCPMLFPFRGRCKSCTWHWAHWPNAICRCNNCTLFRATPQFWKSCACSTDADTISPCWTFATIPNQSLRHVCMHHTIRSCTCDSDLDRPKVISARLPSPGP